MRAFPHSSQWRSVPPNGSRHAKVLVVKGDYPQDLLAREPASPYEREGPFALWHFSEDPSLRRSRPHRPATNPDDPPAVWAVDTRHAPMFWFPRDCPRACIWPVSTTTPEDRERFFGQSATNRAAALVASNSHRRSLPSLTRPPNHPKLNPANTGVNAK
jgi:hypothetical protein